MPKTRSEVRFQRRQRKRQLLKTSLATPRALSRDAVRVGYVNSQGLDERNWLQFVRWIETGTFDLLFVAETWYVGYDEYIAWRHTIAGTCRPHERNGSRYSGGFCVLGTPAIRSRLREAIFVSETRITVTLDNWTLSGLYLPPTLPNSELRTILEDAGASNVVLGDMNVHFHQRRPPERLGIVTQWMQAFNFRRMEPQRQGSPIAHVRLEFDLTVDHCFTRGPSVSNTLHLISASDLGLRTDHRYLLGFTLMEMHRPRRQDADLPRFWIGKLGRETYRTALLQHWSELAPRMYQFLTTSHASVDQLNDGLVWLCQQVCEMTVGRSSSTKSYAATTSGSSRKVDRIVGDQSAMGTYRLMRQVLSWDRDNGPLLPTQAGADALEEMAETLRTRFTAATSFPWKSHYTALRLDSSSTLQPFTLEDIAEELQRQNGTKACGADGIHMYMLRLLQSTSLVEMLASLFNACLIQRTTPQAWNRTEIHVLLKDKKQPKTTSNVRPITLICMFRKIFESLLLRRFDDGSTGWARVHRCQAGFRHSYSTLTNAALLHILLERKLIRSVVFLDFRSAFDVVDHNRLFHVLDNRQCPSQILALIGCLTFANVQSRVLANDSVSHWFPRTCGVLQGSPLSPYLFNLFVDGLLNQLNAGTDAIPRAIFYADDGTLLGTPSVSMQGLVDCVQSWSTTNGIALNVKKCGSLALTPNDSPLYIGDETIPQVDEYQYLGFPITTSGIDFSAHLTRRLDAANRRMQYLDMHAKAWGPAHRLRVFSQYLAPMFEYGAPLVWAWLQTRGARRQWETTTKEWKHCIQWISGTKYGWRVAMNLLGLVPLDVRFQSLHAAFQWQLTRAAQDNPLLTLLRNHFSSQSFAAYLDTSSLYDDWKRNCDSDQFTKPSLHRYLVVWIGSQVHLAATKRHLTSLIPFESRLQRNFRYADATLGTSLEIQEMLFRYRCGAWEVRSWHRCANANRPFRRSDENCLCFQATEGLSKKDWRRMRVGRRRELVGRFTRIDHLLNTHQFARAAAKLQLIRKKLRLEWASQFAED